MELELRNDHELEGTQPNAPWKVCCYCACELDANGRVLTRITHGNRVELPFCAECFDKEYLTREPRWL
jgi:hypothetical protein